jgi:phage terminase small subunit
MNKPAKITAENSKEPQENNHESIKKTPIDPKDFPLKPRQKLFIAEYLVDFNATRAAIAVGYSVKAAAGIGKDNIRKPHIKAEIDKQKEILLKKINITAERVLEETAKVAFAEPDDYKSASPSKLKALELLHKHLGLATDKHEIDIKQPLQLTVKKFCSRKKESGGSNQLPKV